MAAWWCHAATDFTSATTLPGLPTTSEAGGMSPRTTAPAPTIESSPILEPGRMIAPAPTKTRSPIMTRAMRVKPIWRFMLASWAKMITPGESPDSSPMVISHGWPGSR